jgi:long-chain acyl-CoA synthetase
VIAMIAECVEQVNADLAADAMLAGSQIARFLILHKELDPTTTNSRARARCGAASSPRSTACWSTRSMRQARAVHRDAREVRGWPRGQVSATLKLVDVKRFPPVGGARAA